MRILFLTPFVPSSERPAALNHLRLLSRAHEVTLVTLFNREAELRHLDRLRPWMREIHPVRLRLLDSIASCGVRAFSHWPLYSAYYFNRRIQEAIRRIAASRTFDVVHAHTIRMAPYADGLASLPKACNIEDVLTTRFQGYVANDSMSLSRIIDVEELYKLKRFEPWICSQMHATAVISEEEAKALAGLGPSTDIHVVKAGIDANYFTPFPDAERTPAVVFIGRLSYRPNSESALRIGTSIFPKIRARVPGARLLIVGPTPPPAVQRLGAVDGITVAGPSADIRPYLGRAALSLCPMATGGGVKFKILESMAMATPVVTNGLGVRGMGLTPGGNVLVEEDDDRLAEACVSLLTDAARRRSIGEAGLAHVLEHHNWDKIAGSLDAFHEAARAH
jgi:glycosyltransferase involved in cell wall biosynthesis